MSIGNSPSVVFGVCVSQLYAMKKMHQHTPNALHREIPVICH